MDTVDRLVTTAVNAWPLIVLLAGIIYPFLPGPVRAWLQARRIEAESNTHLNDTLLLIDTLWRGYQDARRGGAAGGAAIGRALGYARETRPDLVAKLGATPPVMAKMLNAKVQDHEEALAAAKAAKIAFPPGFRAMAPGAPGGGAAYPQSESISSPAGEDVSVRAVRR